MANRKNPNKIRKVNPNSLANLKKGGSSGRKPVPQEVKEMLESACPDAIRLKINTMNDLHVDMKLRLDCASDILDRSLGKAKQTVDADISGTMSIILEGQVKDWAK